jgi:hypothetical protein
MHNMIIHRPLLVTYEKKRRVKKGCSKNNPNHYNFCANSHFGAAVFITRSAETDGYNSSSGGVFETATNISSLSSVIHY